MTWEEAVNEDNIKELKQNMDRNQEELKQELKNATEFQQDMGVRNGDEI